MISSKERAPRHGPGRLVVDGTDEVLYRRATFAFDPSPRQERALLALLGVCCEVYNAGLQERRDASVRCQAKVSVFDQFKQLTALRGVRDDVFAWGLQPLRGTLRRLDDAYAAFLRRVAAGGTPGFPRFRSRRRFDTVCWDEPTSWRVDPAARSLYLQGVGTVRLPKSAGRQLSRLAARGGVPVTLTVTRKRAGGSRNAPKWVWRATVGFTNVAAQRSEPQRGGGSVIGGDRGVRVTLATSDGGLHAMPPWMAQARDRIVVLQQARARKHKGSRAWRQANRQIAREYRKVAQRSDNWARETARALVTQADVVALEDLNLASMARSAKGTVEQPGTNVKAKQGLNRSLQDAALGRLAVWTCVKAEEAGRRTWLVDPANTSRRCPACGHTDRDNRPARDRFRCVICGHTAHADVNAAVNVAARAQACEHSWQAAGQPLLPRPAPRMRRRITPAAGRAG